VTVEELERPYDCSYWANRKLCQIVSQLSTEHGVHHRGQVALLLRALGFTPGDFDVLFYDAEKGSAVAWERVSRLKPAPTTDLL
jgi:uncharacterized damage-inducible protein DinB